MNRLQLLTRALENIEGYYFKNPEVFILDSAISQIKLLIQITKEEIVLDKEIINLLKLGWIFSREFDGFAEEDLINDIKTAIEIEREIKREYTMRDSFKALIFQPKKRPDSLLRYLGESFKQINSIKKAYFCCLQKDSMSEKPSIVIGLDCIKSLEEIDKDLSLILENSSFSEIMVVNALLTPFSEHFKNIEPFYKYK